ncbi:MAG: hypothetical protein H0V77_09930 [Actinobacteria bacterium]|nr:hypothetical protein [Actinomycetota bacterium]
MFEWVSESEAIIAKLARWVLAILGYPFPPPRLRVPRPSSRSSTPLPGRDGVLESVPTSSTTSAGAAGSAGGGW